VVDAIADKKGEDILLLDIRSLSPFADYFVIGSGTSERQLRALMDGLEDVMRQHHKRRPLSVEGRAESGWVLMDYGDIVVHLFSPEKRAFYDLEGLWREGKTVVRIQ
jgi:ribosome-associated protein